MAGGILPGDDDFDPEKIDRDLERLRNPRPAPSDEELKWWARYQVRCEQVQELQAESLHPNTTASRQAEIASLLPTLRQQLADLEAEGPPESRRSRDG